MGRNFEDVRACEGRKEEEPPLPFACSPCARVLEISSDDQAPFIASVILHFYGFYICILIYATLVVFGQISMSVRSLLPVQTRITPNFRAATRKLAV